MEQQIVAEFLLLKKLIAYRLAEVIKGIETCGKQKLNK
jgi:hypothetical protein